MNTYMWKAIAKVVSNPKIANYLIQRAMRTPYFHLPDYMDRFWLFNRYSEVDSTEIIPRRFPKLPSIRVHHILRADTADHLHDHPWNARTIILKGWYYEKRLTDGIKGPHEKDVWRTAGDTATINFGEYHHISEVSPGGVWTLFFTWEYMGTWGFLVDGKKVPHTEYTGRT